MISSYWLLKNQNHKELAVIKHISNIFFLKIGLQVYEFKI